MSEKLPEFSTQEEGFEWLDSQVNDPYTNNHRFAYKDDEKAMNEYEERQSQGCCGEADYDVVVAGRLAMIGCNYGH